MVSLPMSVWFGRIFVENGHFSKIIQPAIRMSSSSVSSNQWNTKSGNISWLHRKLLSTTATEEQSKTEQPSQDQSAASSTTELKNAEDQIKFLTQEVDNLTKSNEELTDKYKRALADSVNMQGRLLKQIEDAKLFAIQGFCKDLVEVADILAKATECVPKEEVSDTNPHLKNLYEGLTITEAQLKKVFKRHGLIEVNPLNERFDPNQHEALFQQEVEGKEAGTVVVVSKLGYKLHERIVRPAMVGVAKGSPSVSQ